MFCGFSRSVIGASHIKTGLVCQDSSAHLVTENYAIAVVADGHGSKKHFRSNRGSKFAVEATIETIQKFYENSGEFEENLPSNHKLIIKNIQKQIISNWNVKVKKDLENEPVTDEEKSPFTEDEFKEIQPESYYGTTLIAAVSGKDYTFGIQIGDGSLVAVFEDGSTVMPMEYNESAPANVTASICNANAAKMFCSYYIGDKAAVALFTSTDGLYTSFGSEYDFLDYHTIIASQLENIENFKTTITNNITKRSQYGTEDDISLSCVYNEELLGKSIGAIKNKVAENKQKAAERKADRLKRQV